MGLTTSGKMEFLTIPRAFPYKCACCGYGGQNDGRQYLDFGLTFDYDGAVYLCTTCVAELVKVYREQIEPIDTESLTAQLTIALNQIEDLKHYERLVNELRINLNGMHLDSVGISPNPLASASLQGAAEVSATNLTGSDSTAGSVDSKATKRSASKGSNDSVDPKSTEPIVSF